METKANFVLIGAVTVLGVLGLLGLLVWFAKVEIDRQYAWYDVLFEDVSGLGMAGDVRYNGLSVGQVVALDLDADDPGRVRVRIEVAADTPVRTDTTAQLNSQGVTGVAFVSLSGGSPDAPLLLEATGGDGVPVIASERSVIQALTEDAPDLVSEAVEAIREIRSFLGPENRESVAATLRNLESASGKLETALSDFSNISRTVSEGTAEISKFTGRLDEIGTTVQTALVSINDTLDVARVAIAQVEPTMTSARGAFDAAEQTIGGLDTLVQARVPPLADQLASAIASVETATTDLHARLDDVLAQVGGTAETATQRFAQLEPTIDSLDLTLAEARASLAAVQGASSSVQGLVEGDGAALVSDARATLDALRGAIADVDRMLQDDVPAIVAELRAAVTTASAAVDRVSGDITGFTARLDPLIASGETALQDATRTLANANRSFANLDDALATAEDTLVVARGVFARADGVMAADLGPAIADARSAAAGFERTMATLSADLPAITLDLRAVMGRAQDVISKLDAAVDASAPQIESFSRSGLPEFTGFAREARQLVGRLDQLTRRLERDPARFFFGNSIPEFRR